MSALILFVIFFLFLSIQINSSVDNLIMFYFLCDQTDCLLSLLVEESSQAEKSREPLPLPLDNLFLRTINK